MTGARTFPEIDRALLADRLRLACSWLTDRAQIREQQPADIANSHGFRYADWRGSMRGEYSAAKAQWDVFCPIWHTGQAVKALVLAHRVLGDAGLLEAAKAGGAFILRQQVHDPADPDHGFIAAFEDYGDKANTSAILECLDGLFYLADETRDQTWEEAAIRALRWVLRKAYLPGEGLFRDLYDPAARAFAPWRPRHSNDRPDVPGRPLLDDGVFLTGARRAGDKGLETPFWETARRLLVEQDPPGNWIHFAPCNAITGNIHPRHAFWWGMPLIRAWQESGDATFLECARQSAQWYVRAQRHDGGLIRNTYLDFNTDSFGHETSGIACAAILWQRLKAAAGDDAFDGPTRLALDFGMRVQFTHPADENLRGAILSKVLPPDGSDRSPYHLRDLGTTFFVQAASLWLGA
ncbi:MAG: hypothetical protein GXY76_20655 [Chloroflexi bacterium]|nr:hypothetical protein [Chloroflexota bacterium]